MLPPSKREDSAPLLNAGFPQRIEYKTVLTKKSIEFRGPLWSPAFTQTVQDCALMALGTVSG